MSVDSKASMEALARQMLKGDILKGGVIRNEFEDRMITERSVKLYFEVPDPFGRQATKVARALRDNLPRRPNLRGHTQMHIVHSGFCVDICYAIPDFSARFFSGRDKARYLDEQAYHIVARAIALALPALPPARPSSDSKPNLAKRLLERFPDQRHPVDKFLRNAVVWAREVMVDLWNGLRAAVPDRYRDYR